MTIRFSQKDDDTGLELRSCNDNLLSKEPHTRAEIVKWNDDSTCYTVASWEKAGGASFELHFVGSRPFDLPESAMTVFLEFARKGQALLDTAL